MYACSPYGQIFSVIFSMFGIPLMLMVLTNLGRQFFLVLQSVYVRAYRTIRRVKEKSMIIDVPVWIGILATVLWVILCATAFAQIEGWPFAIGFYFTFLSVTTNALGGVDPKKLNTLFLACCVFIGLCLVSMSISIVQQQIDNFVRRIQQEMDKVYQQALNSEDPKKTSQLMRKALEMQQNSWLKRLVSKKQQEKLNEKVVQSITKRSVGCQTIDENSPIEAEKNFDENSPIEVEKNVSADSKPNLQPKSLVFKEEVIDVFESPPSTPVEKLKMNVKCEDEESEEEEELKPLRSSSSAMDIGSHRDYHYEMRGMQMDLKSLRSNASASDFGSHDAEPLEYDMDVQTDYPDVDQECQTNLIPLGENSETFEDTEKAESAWKNQMQWVCETSTQTLYPVEPQTRSTQIWTLHRSVRMQTRDAFLFHRASIFLGGENTQKPPMQRRSSYKR